MKKKSFDILKIIILINNRIIHLISHLNYQNLLLESLEQHINLLICQLIDANQEMNELIFPILLLATLFIIIINFTLNLHCISIHLIYPNLTSLI